MLARLLRRILAAELVFYALLIGMLYLLTQWPPVAALLFAAVLALAGRSLYIVGAFIIAGSVETDNTGGRPGIRCIVAETAALITTQSLRQPLMPWIERLAPRAQRHGPPVVLVHGYCCNAAFWLPLRRRLAREGWRNQYVLSLEPVFGSIDDFAGQLCELLERVDRENPGQPATIVGHSMGGLVARASLRAAPEAPVRAVVTLATPHQGTRLARLGMGRNARQMELDSAWLRALNDDPGSHRVPILAFGSPCDELVSPRTSAFPAFAESVTIGDTGHLRLGTGAAVHRRLIEYLTTARDTPGAA